MLLHAQHTIILNAIGLMLLLSACGGDSHGAWSSDGDDIAPTAPINIAGNAGDGAVSLGWDAPTTGTAPLTYNLTISPTAAAATITRDGTHALIRGLSNDTTYTFSVTAKNNAGESGATTLLLKPTAIGNASAFTAIARDSSDINSPSGIFDPSLLNVSGTIWIAYSSVNYYQQAGNRVQDVSTSLAYSNDGGANFTYLKTIAAATGNVTVTPRGTVNPCGNITCTGRWVYEVPFLVDDRSDPDSAKRFKLFAHKYFLYPAANPSTIYTIGAIVMWTAPSPESTWSNERIVLGWNSTPQELPTTNNVNTLNAALTECLTLSEGSATNYQSSLDFVFACSNGITQKIVLLRSTDHASTFKYVSTPLEAADAAGFNADYFSAPSLLPTESNAPVLMATPVINRAINIGGTPTTLSTYSGCVAFPIADEEAGTLFRSGSTPLSILQIPFIANHLNGACAWDGGVTGSGILINDGDATSSTAQFSILKTGKSF